MHVSNFLLILVECKQYNSIVRVMFYSEGKIWLYFSFCAFSNKNKVDKCRARNIMLIIAENTKKYYWITIAERVIQSILRG